MKTVKNGKLKNVLNIIIVELALYGSALNGSREATEKPRIQSLDENSVNVLENTFIVLELLRIVVYIQVYRIVKYIYMVYHIVLL